MKLETGQVAVVTGAALALPLTLLARPLCRALFPSADEALLVEAEAKANVSGEVLNVRSGKGRASITTDVSDAPRSFSVGAPGETGRYLGAHETGATIVPRRAKVLTIPLDAAKTAAGVPRWSAREAPFEDTFWRRTRAGNLILFGKNRGEPIVPLFLGVAQVTLPQRRWLLPAFEETNQAREELLHRLAKHAGTVLVVVEHVKAGTGGRHQHRIAGMGTLVGLHHGGVHGICVHHGNTCLRQRITNQRCIAPYQHNRTNKTRHGGSQRREVLALAFATQNEHEFAVRTQPL